MEVKALELQELSSFVELAREPVACWYSISIAGEEATITVTAEARAAAGLPFDFVVYREKRVIRPDILARLEARFKLKPEGEYEVRVMRIAQVLQLDLMARLERLGKMAVKGRYLIARAKITNKDVES